MEALPSPNQLMLVTADDFVLGFVNGYCLANQIDFQHFQPADYLDRHMAMEQYGLLILDCRLRADGSDRACGNDHLKIAKTSVESTTVSLCTIFDHLDLTTEWQRSSVRYLVQEPFAEQLSEVLTNHFGHRQVPLVERRKGERRRNGDRRQANRAVVSTRTPDFSWTVRTLPRTENPGVKRVGPFVMEPALKSVSKHGVNLELTSKEFRLFRLLASDTKRVFSPRELIANLWPGNDRASKSDLYQYMHLLRKKIELDPYKPTWVVTVKGVGYRLCVENCEGEGQSDADSDRKRLQSA